MLTMQLPGNRMVPISHPVIKNRVFKGDRLVEVKLYGRLGVAAGQNVFKLAVSSVREAITALHSITSGATTRYIDRTNDRVRWKVLVNGDQIDGDQPSVADELMIERDGIETIEIFPVMEGAANILGLILGAVLLVVGIVLAVYGGITLLPTAIGLIVGGIAGVLGGLIGLFEKPASLGAVKHKNSTQGNPSYLFGGTTNTQQQGGPVPVAYGQLIVGSQCIAALVTNSDLFMTQQGSSAEWEVPVPYSAQDKTMTMAIRAINPDAKNIQLSAVTTPWNQLGSQAFWGYLAKVTLVPYAFNVPTSQQPQIYDNAVYWLMRTEAGTLAASYDPNGNVGPWDTLQAFPQEMESIIVTQNQENYSWWAPTANLA